MKRTLFLVLMYSAMLVLCNSCECPGGCADDKGYLLQLKSFSQAEIGKVVIKNYVKGTGFTQLKDSTVYDNRFYLSDTITGISYSDILYADSVDVVIDFPKVPVAYQLTAISFRPNQCKCTPKTFHFNQLATYKLNGTLFTATAYPDSAQVYAYRSLNMVVITK